jgi:hypothetical protein
MSSFLRCRAAQEHLRALDDPALESSCHPVPWQKLQSSNAMAGGEARQVDLD